MAIFDEILVEEGDDMTEATGFFEGAIEDLAATEGVGLGKFGPGAGGGELPEDPIEQEAGRPGNGTGGPPFFGGVAVEEGGGLILGKLG